MSRADIAAMLERYGQAVRQKDLDAFISLYDPEARVFDAWGRWAYDGLHGWRQAVRAWFDALVDEYVVVASEDIRVEVEGDLATLHGIAVYSAFTSGGKPLHSMRNRLTWILRRAGGTWKVLHEHTSVPLDFETKAMLRD